MFRILCLNSGEQKRALQQRRASPSLRGDWHIGGKRKYTECSCWAGRHRLRWAGSGERKYQWQKEALIVKTHAVRQASINTEEGDSRQEHDPPVLVRRQEGTQIGQAVSRSAPCLP